MAERMTPAEREDVLRETMRDAALSREKLTVGEIAGRAGLSEPVTRAYLAAWSKVRHVQFMVEPRGDRLPPVRVFWLTPAGRRAFGG